VDIVRQGKDQGKDDGQSQGAIWDLQDDNVLQHAFMAPFRNWKEHDLVQNPGEAFAFWKVEPHEKETIEVVFYKGAKKHPAVLERRLALAQGRPGKILLFTTTLDDRSPRWNNYLETAGSSMFVGLCWLATNYLAGQADSPKLNFMTGREEPVVALP